MTPPSDHTSTASKIEGFLSYAHKSDKMLGFAAPLHDGLVDMIKLVANRDIEIFLDRNDIKWGSRWQSVIDNGLESSSVLFVVATTHYLDSDACRDEFTTFLNTAKATGREQATRLILPIMPIDASGVFNRKSKDPIARAIAEIQYELIEDAVLEGVGTPAWRHAMRRLATRFVEVVDAAEASLSSEGAREPDDDAEASPGKGGYELPLGLSDEQIQELFGPKMVEVDSLALAPSDGPRISSALEVEDDRGVVELVSDMEEDLEEITTLATMMSDGMTKLTASVEGINFDQTPSARDLKTKFMTVAQRMKPHAKAIGDGGLVLRDTVTRVDVSLRKLLALRLSTGDQTDIEELRGQLERIESGLIPVKATGEKMNDLLDSMVGAEMASSAMRQTLKPMRTGLVAFGDAARIMTSWGPGMLSDKS